MESFMYPNWIEVDLSAVEHNVKTLIKRTNLPLLAVVKANAYGMGAVEVGKTAMAAGATSLGVARFYEAMVLRKAGIKAPILVLGMVTPDEVALAIKQKITLTAFSFEYADMLGQKAAEANGKLVVHLKVDTGMSRLGIFPEDMGKFAAHVAAMKNIEIEGMYSHFAMAGTPGHPNTPGAIKLFKLAVANVADAGIHPKWIHLANSAGTYFEKDSWFTMNRAGSAVTGIGFRDDVPFPKDLKRALTWKVRLAMCKDLPLGRGISYGHKYFATEDQTIGTLPLGYGDGFRRLPGNQVLIDGKRVPVVGKECMDQCMVRLPKKYPYGTEVVVIGKQGKEEITLEELARLYDTPEVDISSSINARVPRVYMRS